MSRKIGYARVSTKDQKLKSQTDDLKKFGCDPILHDIVSGAKSERPGLDKCLEELKKGDTLVVWRLDRLGRSMQHLVSVVTDLKEKGIGFKSLCDGAIDTTTASGELIFNIFDEKRSFSESVLLARENGFTEPDPREDLNGSDVARKLLILIRESGLAFEFREIKVENLIPMKARKSNTISEFFTALKQNDQAMEKIRKDAQEKGKVLRYIATFANGRANSALRDIGSEHPFFVLHGNENIVSIYTNYYQKYGTQYVQFHTRISYEG